MCLRPPRPCLQLLSNRHKGQNGKLQSPRGWRRKRGWKGWWPTDGDSSSYDCSCGRCCALSQLLNLPAGEVFGHKRFPASNSQLQKQGHKKLQCCSDRSSDLLLLPQSDSCWDHPPITASSTTTSTSNIPFTSSEAVFLLSRLGSRRLFPSLTFVHSPFSKVSFPVLSLWNGKRGPAGGHAHRTHRILQRKKWRQQRGRGHGYWHWSD